METEQGDDQRPELSDRDELTGTLSRRAIEDVLIKAIEEVEAGGGIVGVSSIQIDSLSSINDQVGHAAGDRVLKQIADALRTAFGPDSKVGRMGGDEFLVVSIGIPEEELLERAESAKRSAIQEDSPANGSHAPAADLSLGIAWSRGNGRSAGELIEAAEKATYLARRARGYWEDQP